MIKVAHILNTFLPVTENWIYNQIKYNSECKHIVISQFVKNVDQFPVDTLYSACWNQYQKKILSYCSRMKFWPHQSFYDSIIQSEKPDIIHGHLSYESWRVARIAKKKNIPLVTTFYGVDVNKLPQRNYWKKRYPVLFDIGSLFLVEGNFMAKKLVENGCDSQKIKVIHMGVDIERIRNKLDFCKSDSTVFKVLFTGLGREKKGALDAVEAFCGLVNEYKNAELHLVGDGEYKKTVEKKLYENGCKSKAFFYGYVNVNRYLQLLVESDVVLTPSCTAKDGDTEGGAPVVCIEAQAAGKAVVGTNHCDIPEIVIDGKTGLLCEEHDIDSLADNLINLAKNPQLRKKMGEQGMEHVKNNHDINKQAVEIASAYKSVLSKREI